MSNPVLIDCDPGIDDAVALLLALASPEDFRIVGITTVAGNVDLARTAANACRIRELAARSDVPVHAGCPQPLVRALRTGKVHGPGGLDGGDLPDPASAPVDEHAVAAIIRHAETLPGLVVCALGPLTNLAVALTMRPRIAGNIARVVVMGGSFAGGNVTPHAEFNFHVDPHAAQAVLQAGLPLALFPLDATRQAQVTPRRLAAIEAVGNRTAQAVAGMLRYYGRAREGIEDGEPLHDPLVPAFVMRPDLFATVERHVEMVLEGEAAGRSLAGNGAANAQVVDRVDADGFFALLTERLARLP